MAPNPHQITTYLGYGGKGEPAAPQIDPAASYGQGITYYKAGDQWGPANQSADQVRALQLRLVAAGYGPKGGLRSGVWSKDSADALSNAMRDANYAGGQNIDSFLTQQIDSGAGGAGGGGSVGPEKRAVTKPNLVTGGHALEVTASQDIEKQAGDTFSKILGRNMRPDETLAMVQQVQNLDLMQKTQQANAEDTTKGASFMQDMATANQRQAESNAAADQSLALHQQAQGAGANTILPGADTSGMQIGGFQTQLPNQKVEAAPNPQAYAEWVIKTRMPNEYLGSQMADRARQMGDFLTKPTAPQGGPLTRTRV